MSNARYRWVIVAAGGFPIALMFRPFTKGAPQEVTA